MKQDKLLAKEKKREEVFEFLKDFAFKNGYPPSVREICAALNIKSTSTVHLFLKELEDKNLVKRNPTKPRALEINGLSMSSNSNFINIPIIGTIAAGAPILAEENIEGYFSLPINFVKHNNELFILKVSGDSMVNAGINNNDLAIIEKCDFVDNGKIAAVLIDNNATLKTFYKENERIRLQPQNSFMDPIIVDDCQVIGNLVGIYRKY